MIYKLLAVLTLSIVYLKALAAAPSNSLQAFETDYCTMFVEGPPGNPNLWKSCCFDHDLRYWFGGRLKQRHRADLKLKSCVRAKAGAVYANMMYYAIRTGHYSPVKSKYKWGWGWSLKRDNSPLTNDEKTYVKEELRLLDLEADYLQEFIKLYEL